ncbi:MAG: rod shape-determining protein MreC [Bacteroidota bacterium]
MQQLFGFIYRNRSLFTFLLLLSIGFFLVFRFNDYPGAVYFHTSNRVSGQLLDSRQGVMDFFGLREVNQTLAEENAQLRQALLAPLAVTAGTGRAIPTMAESLPGQFRFIPAKVINNSWNRFRNYLTLNKGAKDGLEPGMAVMGTHGVVGQVKYVSQNFATVISLLYTDWEVSSTLASIGSNCSVSWSGADPLKANVLYLPLHTQLTVGDTVVTSGYNAVFPSGMPIGTVSAFEQTTDANFFDVTIDLVTDFQALRYVYVVENSYLPEQDSLQQLTDPVL